VIIHHFTLQQIRHQSSEAENNADKEPSLRAVLALVKVLVKVIQNRMLTCEVFCR
jgi:hypothetical protein